MTLFGVRMQFDAKKESSSSDPKLKDEERLHTLVSCNYLQPDFQNPKQGLVRGSASCTQESLPWCRHPLIVLLFIVSEQLFVYETLGRADV